MVVFKPAESICRSLSPTHGSYRFSFLTSAWALPEPLWEDCDSPSELLPWSWEYPYFVLNLAALSAGTAFDIGSDVGFGSANNTDIKAKSNIGLILCANFCGKVVSGVKCLFLSLGHWKTLQNYSHFGTMNWKAQKTAEYLLGVWDFLRQKTHKLLLPSRAIAAHQDRWGLKTKVFCVPISQGHFASLASCSLLQ